MAIEDIQSRMYANNIMLKAQQEKSIMMDLFPTHQLEGILKSFPKTGKAVAEEIVEKFQPSVPQTADYTNRVAFSRRLFAEDFLDKIDEHRMLVNPNHTTIIKLAAALGRKFDDIIFESLLGNANEGENGTSLVALGSGQQIAHGSAGLTIAKFNQALRMLDEAEEDRGSQEVYAFLPARAIEDLLSETNFISADFRNTKMLEVKGKAYPQFRGVNLIQTERVPIHTAGSVYRGVICTQDALNVVMNHNIEFKMSELPLHKYAAHTAAFLMMGAVRMDETKVVDVLFQ